ncbi:putative tRNA nucleotidyltransferase [Vibrio phage 496E54-1]|nr:putative tRNA nucleotidyltransferase [Vibrio phage 495E54-1]CAH9013782.1 putative tRNA nucleotidyltransferase [Vibrio phage 496E54-1]
MKFYLVGGACRDLLMGNAPKDYDFVVVGATPTHFKDWQQVGKDFPVFLHPTYGWEVALARVERKTGVGYGGFSSEWNGVTLEEDLSRRDLTINSIAIEVDWEATQFYGEPITVGTWIDPYDGIKDIKQCTLRHTTDAFKEDPLRVLRVARFLARFGKEWKINFNTQKIMEEVYLSGELLTLTKERVWLETEKALSETTPSLYFETLKPFDCIFSYQLEMESTVKISEHHPEANVWEHCKMVMDVAATLFKDPEIVWAGFCHDLAKYSCMRERGNMYGHEEAGSPIVEDLCEKWKVPNRYKHLALITTEFHGKVHNALGRNTNKGMKPKSIMKLFENTGALKNPERFLKMLKACEADTKGRGVDEHEVYEYTKEYFLNKPYPQRQYLEECLESVLSYNSGELSKKMLSEGKSGIIIGDTIRSEKIKCIREVSDKWKSKN